VVTLSIDWIPVGPMRKKLVLLLSGLQQLDGKNYRVSLRRVHWLDLLVFLQGGIVSHRCGCSEREYDAMDTKN
jgi:hypothetical protein